MVLPNWNEVPRRQKVRMIVVAVVIGIPVLLLALSFGTTGRIVVLVAAGVLFGFFGVLMVIRNARLRRNPADRACLHATEIEVDADRETVERRARAAITKLNASIDPEPSEQGVLYAEVPGGWRSFGELLAIDLHQNEDAATTAVRIESWCTYTGTALDWGKNRQNVLRLRREIQS